MGDIEKARQQLSECGYQHPETNIYSNTKLYKTFDTEAKKEAYKKPQISSCYAKFTDKDMSFELDCPKCGDKALYMCNCEFKDKQCKNGHVWFTNTNGKIQNGDPHEN